MVSANGYVANLVSLFPRSRLIRVESGTVLYSICEAIADELARIDARAALLLSEMDPSQATDAEMLSDWERNLEIEPDGSASETVRQQSVVAKFVYRGGASEQYFIDLAASLGFLVTISYPSVHEWRMIVDLAGSPGPHSLTEKYFRSGTAVSGDRLWNRYSIELEGTIDPLVPAHTGLSYYYF